MIFQDKKRGDLTQSHDKSPYTNRNEKKGKWQHKQRHKKIVQLQLQKLYNCKSFSSIVLC